MTGPFGPWALVYVFDPRRASGYVCRTWRWMADLIIRGEPSLDWWPNAEGDLGLDSSIRG